MAIYKARTIRCIKCGKKTNRYQDKVFCSIRCGVRYRSNRHSKERRLIIKNKEFIISNKGVKKMYELVNG